MATTINIVIIGSIYPYLLATAYILDDTKNFSILKHLISGNPYYEPLAWFMIRPCTSINKERRFRNGKSHVMYKHITTFVVIIS